MLPFTPAWRNNMVAWMAARCDGEKYGQILVYRFPKQALTYGPAQIEARIDQRYLHFPAAHLVEPDGLPSSQGESPGHPH